MSLDKAKIDGAIYDVITLEELYKDPSSYGKYNAVYGGDGYIYPIRNGNDTRPGMVYTGGFEIFHPPVNQEDHVKYSTQNIISFHDATSLKDIIETQQRLNSEERSILTTIDNVFIPEIGENDTPEMNAFKRAIIKKHIDLDKYESRIGPNYNNDKRLLKKSSMTFGKMRDLGKDLDMKITITIEDASPNVPNPMGCVISAEITGSGTNEETEE